eukprot:5652865-Pleurochrysis_carterae.AAC.5
MKSSIEPPAPLDRRARKSVLPLKVKNKRFAQAAARDIIASGKYQGARTAAAGLASHDSSVSCGEPTFENKSTTWATGVTPARAGTTSTCTLTPPTTTVQNEAEDLPSSNLLNFGKPATKTYLMYTAVQLYKDKRALCRSRRCCHHQPQVRAISRGAADVRKLRSQLVRESGRGRKKVRPGVLPARKHLPALDTNSLLKPTRSSYKHPYMLPVHQPTRMALCVIFIHMPRTLTESALATLCQKHFLTA